MSNQNCNQTTNDLRPSSTKTPIPKSLPHIPSFNYFYNSRPWIGREDWDFQKAILE
jgi:hypothetical protein